METKVPLSVVVITKNEEKNIQDCLSSVAWADEIIVVDDYSSDGTVGLAKKYTDRIFQRKMDVEGIHRNWAYQKAGNTWVLSLDADERVTPELSEEIKGVLAKGTDCNGFTIPRRNYIGDYWIRHGGWYPSPQLKLFKRDKFKYEEVEVHPRAFMDEPCGHLKNDIVHYSYRDFEDFRKKQDNQAEREATKWLKANRKISFFRACWRAIDRFFRSYVGKQGFRDGKVGFEVAIFAARYQINSFAKYSVLKNKESR